MHPRTHAFRVGTPRGYPTRPRRKREKIAGKATRPGLHHLDLDLLGLHGLGLREVDLQHFISVRGLYLVALDRDRQRDVALELPVPPLKPLSSFVSRSWPRSPLMVRRSPERIPLLDRLTSFLF